MRALSPFLFLSALATCIPTAFAELKIELGHSEAASYLHFLSTGFGEPFTSGALKEKINKQSSLLFENSENKALFLQFKSYLQNGYNYADESPNRPDGFWAEDALLALAAQSKTLASFENQLSILIPYRGIIAYQKLKERAHPVFQSLLWKPTLAAQKREIEDLRKLTSKTGFLSQIKKARIFYGSDYPDSLPFKVALIPIPDSGLKNKHTSATNLRDVQVVPYLVSSGARDSLDVVFHEFCHALYEAQPPALKKLIDDFFMQSKDPHALFVYRYMNEILATAWGNGRYGKTLKGDVSNQSWYTVAYVDRLAKAALSLIEGYAAAGKPMDRPFLEQLISLAKTHFPDGPREIAPNFMALRLLIDQKSDETQQLKREIKGAFRIQSFHTSSPMQDDDLESIRKTDLKNTMLITFNLDNAKKRLQKQMDLSSVTGAAGENKSFLAIIPNGSNYLFWAQIEDTSKLSPLLARVKELKHLPEQTLVLNPLSP